VTVPAAIFIGVYTTIALRAFYRAIGRL